MGYDHIIWDWNGTLFDDVHTCIAVENRLLRSRNMGEIESLEAYHRVFCFPVIDYYKKLGFDFSKEDFATVAEEYVTLYDEACASCTLHTGAEAVLQALQKMGVRQYIVSASSQKSLENQMRPFSIHSYFAEILGIQDNFAKSKLALAQRLIESQNITPNRVLMIGDTLHDYEVAQALSCHCVLIPKGHHSASALKETGGTLLGDISGIPNYIKGDLLC